MRWSGAGLRGTPDGLPLRTDLIGAVLCAIVITLLVLRLPLGLDLTDESYYALFVDDWLKGDVDSSPFTVLHQTSALLVYPAAQLYEELNGSTDGMLLFLRAFYLVAHVTAAAVWIIVWRRAGSRFAAWSSGLLLLSFIPFGLPAPSYNTLGVEALVVGLSCVMAARSPRGKARWLWWSGASASAAVMTVAYPPLVLGCVVLAVAAMATASAGQRRQVASVVALATAVGLGAWLLVASVLGVERLHESVTFLAGSSDTGGAVQKARQLGGTLKAHPGYLIVLTLVMVTGSLRAAPRWLRPAVLCTAVVTVSCLPAALPPKSHDLITLLALSSLATLGDLRSEDRRARLTATVYGLSLLSGAVTAYFATYPTSNFALGAAPAAAIAASSLAQRAVGRPEQLVAVVATATVLWASLTTYYGERAGEGGDRVQIQAGFFAGVRASAVDAETQAVIRRELLPLLAGETETVYVGPQPGIVLSTPLRLRMLTAYNLYPYPAATRATLDQFYDQPRNRPRLVIVHTTAGAASPNPLGERFSSWYALDETVVLPDGVLRIYRARSA